MFKPLPAVHDKRMRQTDMNLDLSNRRTRKRMFLDEVERVVPAKIGMPGARASPASFPPREQADRRSRTSADIAMEPIALTLLH
jgi:hypothetical protein